MGNTVTAEDYWRNLIKNCDVVHYKFHNESTEQNTLFLRIIPKALISYPHELYFRVTSPELGKKIQVYYQLQNDIKRYVASFDMYVNTNIHEYVDRTITGVLDIRSPVTDFIAEIKDNYVTYNELGIRKRNQIDILHNWHKIIHPHLIFKVMKGKTIRLSFSLTRGSNDFILPYIIYNAELVRLDFSAAEYKLISFKKNNIDKQICKDFEILCLNDNSTTAKEINGILDCLVNTYCWIFMYENLTN